MNPSPAIDLGTPGVLEISGPDALRFLNGQITQDLGLTIDSDSCLPSFVTDAKGRMQFHVWVMSWGRNRFRVLLVHGNPAELENRLSKYLVADDAEITNLTGAWRLLHLPGGTAAAPTPPPGTVVKQSKRLGTDGADWWIPATETRMPEGLAPMEEEESEHLRVSRAVPGAGKELVPGMLVQEIGIQAPEFSYNKGCYIGQEVVSRIKSAGKLHRMLARIRFDASLPVEELSLSDAQGRGAGTITSVSPLAEDKFRTALAFVNPSAAELSVVTRDGARHPVGILP